MKAQLRRLGHGIKRLNQVLLTLPVWLVTGIAGITRSTRQAAGWTASDHDERYDKLY